MVEGASWQWISWLNVLIGVALLALAWFRLTESCGPATRLDLTGLLLASLGLAAKLHWGSALARGMACVWHRLRDWASLPGQAQAGRHF